MFTALGQYVGHRCGILGEPITRKVALLAAVLELVIPCLLKSTIL